MQAYILGLVGAVALTAAATAQAQVVYDATPTVGFTYGVGNDYTPANAVVLTSGENELALRAHVPFLGASSTGGTGIYNFALGSDVSFDYSIFGSLVGANILLTNLLTSDTAFFDPVALGGVQTNGALQNSQRLSFGFLNGTGPFTGCCGDLNFDSSINNTYRIDLTSGGQTISAFAQIGTGAVAAVPEPATWAMMLIGFGAMGVAMRRRRRIQGLIQTA